MRLFTALLLTSFMANAAPTPRFTDTERRAKLLAAAPRIQQIFEEYQKSRRMPGLVYGLVIDGEPVLIKGIGVRDRRANDPVTADTVFRIASMTKSFTALAILKLRDEGKLSLEDPVAKWIPEFARMKYPTADTAPVRIRELLTHGAGFPEDNPWGDRQLGIAPDVLTRWLKEGIPFSTPPNTEFEYSNYGFALLGRIVSKASHMPYKEYLTKQILLPIGMKSSTLETSEVPPNLRATAHRFSPQGQVVEDIAPLAHGEFGAMGGLWTTANDLAKYVAYHLSAYPPRDEAETGPVRRSSMREQQSAARPSSFRAVRSGDSLRATDGAYGFGLSVTRDCRFPHIVSHGGGLPGFGSFMQWLPEYGVGMFAMANLTYAGPAQPIDQSWDALLETGALKPRTLPPSTELTTMRDKLFSLWNDWNETAANAVAADNLWLDRPAANRGSDIQGIKQQVGKCSAPGEVDPENWLRGTFRMPCERGAVYVSFTLAPTQPPKVQQLRFQPVSALQPSVQKSADAVAALFDANASGRLSDLAAASFDSASVRRKASDLRKTYGGCRVGDPVAGDGKTFARVRLECDRGRPEVLLRSDESGKLTGVEFQAPAGSACSL